MTITRNRLIKGGDGFCALFFNLVSFDLDRDREG